MRLKRGIPLYRQVADELGREVLPHTSEGDCLPSDGELARRWNVSVRTVREALLVLEAQGRVERQQGRGTVVCRPSLPVALFSELNLLHPRTPRFFGLVLDTVKGLLEEDGYRVRLYTGKSCTGEPSGAFTCPELVEDAEAGQLAGIVAMTSGLDTPRLQKLRKKGLPMVTVHGNPLFPGPSGPAAIPGVGVPYLVSDGRERIGLIGWDAQELPGAGELVANFADALREHGLAFSPDRCRVELSFGLQGAGWEAFREIWFASSEKPDALIVSDENYLPEVTMAALQLGIRIPEDLLIVSHRTRHVQWQSPAPIAYIEEDVDMFGEILAGQALAALAGEPTPTVPAGTNPYHLVPLQGRMGSRSKTALQGSVTSS